uniref:Rho GTPase-activating protein 39 n=1 Tax=Onchocerca volvulus TaxID=6282 RepID=A0A8R1TN79_ONCVO
MDEERSGSELHCSSGMKIEWVEIVEPQTRQYMYANLRTGQCAWEPPEGVPVKKTASNQWWELFDTNSQRFYYYNATTMQTVWQKPVNCDIIPLAKLQTLKENTELHSNSERDDGCSVFERTITTKRNNETQTSPKEERRSGSSRSLSHTVFAQNISPESGIVTARRFNSPRTSMSRKTYNASSSPLQISPGYIAPLINSVQEMRIYSNRECLSRNAPSMPGASYISRDDSFEGHAAPVQHQRPQIVMSTRTASSASNNAIPSFIQSSAGSSSSSLTMSNSRFPLDDGTTLKKCHNSTSSPKVREFNDVTVGASDCWTKDSIKQPVSGNMDDKHVKKEAPNMFKVVQNYMGDRKSKTSNDQLALTLCEWGISKESLADELFCQVMKQLTGNERFDSIRRGWELLAIFLAFFSPSNPEITQKLTEFIEANSDRLLDMPEVPVSHYAIQCSRRLARLSATRPKPSLSLIQESRVHIFNPPQFCTPLEELMEMQAEKYPERILPWLETTLIDLILSADGQHTEGLFRVPADPDHVHTARLRLDRGLIPVVRDAHVPAALLKLWLRSLPEPLLPDTFYLRCLAVCDQPEEACRIAELLPAVNRLVLAKLLELLQLLAEEETVKYTKMDVCNLAMVMAPNVLRCGSDDPRIIFDNARREMTFLKTLILHYDTSFIRSIS